MLIRATKNLLGFSRDHRFPAEIHYSSQRLITTLLGFLSIHHNSLEFSRVSMCSSVVIIAHQSSSKFHKDHKFSHQFFPAPHKLTRFLQGSQNLFRAFQVSSLLTKTHLGSKSVTELKTPCVRTHQRFFATHLVMLV